MCRVNISRRWPLAVWLLVSVLASLSAQDRALLIYESELVSLKQACEVLRSENVRLRTMRSDSSDNSTQTQSLLQDSEKKIAEQATLIEASEKRIADLENSQTIKQDEIEKLREALTEARRLLEESTKYWNEYKAAAEAKIRRLELTGWLALGCGVAAGVLAALVVDHWPEIVKALSK